MKTHFPELLEGVDRLLDDSAADSDILKKQILDDFELEINCNFFKISALMIEKSG